MRYADLLARNRIRYFVVGIAVFAMMNVPQLQLARAESTIINTVVCSPLPAALNITAPQSGTVVAQNPVQITGTIERVSQIRVSVDGVYHDTIPIAVNDASFSYSYYVPAGTHTVALVGVDLCQNADAEQSIVLGYANGNAVTPTSGSSGNDLGAPADSVMPPASPLSQLEATPFGRVIAGAMYNTLVALDFATPSSLAQVPVMAGRFMLTAVGMTALILPSVIYAGFRGLQATVMSSVLPQLGAFAGSRTRLAIRIAGFILLLVPIVFLA